ncbi:hypothetical protein F383_18376 [Gossypium arboreum]|uniref:Uncharacterized protein n=1 Tax=Gossypium arboreum TaxID=29729 RepID=A0A0B0NLB9_GOSAR|nr:hypothetical protein F383_18376 [Gossypium arboreum]
MPVNLFWRRIQVRGVTFIGIRAMI